MILFRVFLAIAAAVTLVVMYFFLAGLADGTVSSFNMTLWLALVGGVIAVLTGGVFLNTRGQRGAAIAVLALLAVPGILAALFIVMMLVLQPRWN